MGERSHHERPEHAVQLPQQVDRLPTGFSIAFLVSDPKVSLALS